MGALVGRVRGIFEVPAYSAAFMAINLLLGAGPIIVPEPFFEAGILLSTLWTAAILAISFNSAMYVGESMEKIKRHRDGQREGEGRQDNTHKDSMISEDEEGALLQNNFESCDHIEQFRFLYGERWKMFPALAISVYLLGVSISKCIMTGKTLSRLFTGVELLETFEFWLTLFFLSGALFSFRSISKTKPIQVVTIGVRFISVVLMILGAVIIIFQNDFKMQFTPPNGNALFNMGYFGDIFSNLVFSFLFHHSIPTITQTLSKTTEVRSFIRIAFRVAGAVMFIIPITAIMAFGGDLVHKRGNMLGQSHDLIYYSQDFKGRLDFVYYIVSFYLFLNVTAFSVYIIVIRENVFGIFFPSIDPNKPSKPTLAFSLSLLAVILLVSFVARNQIQTALSFTAGIFGSIILFVMPCMEVYRARKLFPPEKSWMNSYVWMPLFLIGLGVAVMSFQLYQIISNLVK